MRPVKEPLLNGQIYCKELDDWIISWESDKTYRYWCSQCKNGFSSNLLVIMFNPGSLSNYGKNLRKDTTLRVLRNVCDSINTNVFVVNLYDYAAPKPEDLFNNWEQRISKFDIFDHIKEFNCKNYIMAYGDYENYGKKDQEIKNRIKQIKSKITDIKEILLPKNKSGTPKHPKVWQTQKLKSKISKILKEGVIS